MLFIMLCNVIRQHKYHKGFLVKNVIKHIMKMKKMKTRSKISTALDVPEPNEEITPVYDITESDCENIEKVPLRNMKLCQKYKYKHDSCFHHTLGHTKKSYRNKICNVAVFSSFASETSLSAISNPANISTASNSVVSNVGMSLPSCKGSTTDVKICEDETIKQEAIQNEIRAKNDEREKYLADSKKEISRLKHFRSWKNTRLGNQFKNSDDSAVFTIVTYNILAQHLLEVHRYMYCNHDARALIWPHRLSRIVTEITNFSAQIVCLQEVQEDHLDQLVQHLKPLNYTYIYKQRTRNNTDGCAIFYNTQFFTLLEHIDVEYLRPESEILNRDNIGVIGKFRVNSLDRNNTDDQNVIVATTHLLYNPRRSDVRLAQVQIMLAEIDKIAYSGRHQNGTAKYLPIILTGDFNLKPESAVYNLITKGQLMYSNLTVRTLEYNYQGLPKQGRQLVPRSIGLTDQCQHFDVFIQRCKGKEQEEKSNLINLTRKHDHPELFGSGVLSHELNLKSAYKHRTHEGLDEASTFHQQWITVDYIFYNQYYNTHLHKVIEGRLKLISRYTLPSDTDCQNLGTIPNLAYGSDHLPLAATFILKR